MVECTQQGSSPPTMSLKHFLYTTIRHLMLKDRLIELVQLCFRKKIQCRYKYIVFGKDKSYFVTKNKKTLILPKGSLKLIDNIVVMFVGRDFQQTVSIPMDIYCAPLLADLFLYSYKTYFILGLHKKNENPLISRSVI